eukprot:scaffold134683_cov32-Prasinocladus_malaysianus.AAC.1
MSALQSFDVAFDVGFNKELGVSEIYNVTVSEPKVDEPSPTTAETPWPPVDTNVTSVDLGQEPNEFKMPLFIVLMCVGGLALLAVIGLAVWLAKRNKQEPAEGEGEEEESVMYSNPVAGTEQQPPPPDV